MRFRFCPARVQRSEITARKAPAATMSAPRICADKPTMFPPHTRQAGVNTLLETPACLSSLACTNSYSGPFSRPPANSRWKMAFISGS